MRWIVRKAAASQLWQQPSSQYSADPSIELSGTDKLEINQLLLATSYFFTTITDVVNPCSSLPCTTPKESDLVVLPRLANFIV